jgi:class 3 adenylate cyclase
MTAFQVVASVVFVVVLLMAYRKQLASFLTKTVGVAAAPEVQHSIAVMLVNDIVAVTNLRDKLSAEDCPEGVEACTNLLRVIVEHKQPSKGVV